LASFALGKSSRVITAGGVLLAAAGMVYVLVSANRSTDMVKDALAAKEDRLVKYREKLLEKDAVDEELATLKGALGRAEASLLAGETPSLAAAEVQEIVTSAASAAGGQIKTIRVLPPEPLRKQTYLAIPVEVTLNSTMGELTRLLYSLEGSAKLLRVSKMEIKSLGGRGGGGIREALVTTLVVEGFEKKRAEQG